MKLYTAMILHIQRCIMLNNDLAIGSDIVNVGCLGCIGDYITQLYGDFHKPL